MNNPLLPDSSENGKPIISEEREQRLKQVELYKAWLEKEREDKEKALQKIKTQPPSTTKLG